MRLTTFSSLLLPILATASIIPSAAPSELQTALAQVTSDPILPAASAIPVPEVLSAPSIPDLSPERKLELRQEDVTALAATVGATQQGTVMTAWMMTSVGPSTATYVEVIYTQTFAAVPDQLPTPGVGSIGMGTITEKAKKAKRTDVVASSAAVRTLDGGRAALWKGLGGVLVAAVGFAVL